MEQDGKQNGQRQKQHENGLPLHQAAQDGSCHPAGNKYQQHPQMGAHARQMRPVPVAQGFTKGHAGLAQMIGTEGGGHGDALGLAEGIILHGADEVDGDLGNLKRRRFRQQPQKYHRQHF